MTELVLRGWHERANARFIQVNGTDVVEHYGDPLAEHSALRETAGLLDLSGRTRLCLSGADRHRFLHGQITNAVKDLKTGQGCYAALVNAKGRMEADLNVYCLEEELLLDLEPGLTARVTERLQKYIIADDVQIADASPHYGLLSVIGPRALDVVNRLAIPFEATDQPQRIHGVNDPALGLVYRATQPRGVIPGFDLFLPIKSLESAAEQLVSAARAIGGRAGGWQALETLRIEAGLPRYGLDMDESNLPPEAGLDQRAISYSKGCYIGQEVISRIRTYGQVSKTLRGLLLPEELPALPARGDKLVVDAKPAGYVTSAVFSPVFQRKIALGYVRREFGPGTELLLSSGGREYPVRTVALPFDQQEMSAARLQIT